jgi:glycosyltransferase involved in cell wall biosynthesis
MRYLRFLLAIITNYRSPMSVLVAGSFLETLAASLIRRFKYTIKIPGDIVWERARNYNLTNLDILEFQNSKLNFRYRLFRALFFSSINRADKIIVPSKMLKSLVSGWTKTSSKIVLIYNSINLSQFFGLTDSKKRFDVVTACRLVPWKGVAELIRACKELKLSLAIAGEGPERSNLEELSDEIHAEVTFLGQIPKNQMRGIYALSDTFILNSSYEGLPHALIEAKASQMLCIARAGTGSEEVITDMEDGLLVGGESGNSLTLVLKFALSERANSARLRASALNDVKNRFDQETNFHQILEVIKRR